MNTLRIATRKSPLALWQAEFIRDRLMEQHAGLQVELVTMTTQGDRWLSSPLSEVGGKGLFIKELEQAMLDGRADAAVHSMKDVPAVLPEGFVLGAVGFRDDVRDVLVGSDSGITGLPQGAVVGSSSLRRQSQLKALRPDLELRPVRGNVGTRLEKLRSGEYDAIVLAAAGLKRLGLALDDVSALSVDDSLPAAGQAALGVECLSDAEEVRRLIGALNDDAVAATVTAERSVSAGLGADCSMPLAAHATLHGNALTLRARLGNADGSTLIEARAQGASPEEVGARVVEELLSKGARDILAAFH